MESCVYCKSEKSKVRFDIQDIFKDNYQLRECLQCETSYLNPKPTSKQLERAYNDDYYGEGETKFNPTVEKVIDFFRQSNAKRMAKLFNGKGAILDLGCGNGSFLSNIGKHGNFELYGLELQGKSAERAKEKKEIKLTVGELREDTYPINSFDVITLIHVFEHLPNPKESLIIIRKILKPDGLLLLEFPNIDSWQSSYFKQHWLHLDPPRHLNLFKPKRLKMELEILGFSCVKESYMSTQFSPFGMQQSFLNCIGIKRDLLYEFLKGNNNYCKDHSKISLYTQQLFPWLTFPLFAITDIIA